VWLLWVWLASEWPWPSLLDWACGAAWECAWLMALALAVWALTDGAVGLAVLLVLVVLAAAAVSLEVVAAGVVFVVAAGAVLVVAPAAAALEAAV
jgi:hypothetical protein